MISEKGSSFSAASTRARQRKIDYSGHSPDPHKQLPRFHPPQAADTMINHTRHVRFVNHIFNLYFLYKVQRSMVHSNRITNYKRRPSLVPQVTVQLDNTIGHDL